MIEILQEQIDERGIDQIAKELGVSRTTVYLVMKGKYKGSIQNIEEKVKKIYGNGGIHCPILGPISPAQCADIREKAEFLGKYVSNPEKIRLYMECKRCKIRE